MDIAMTRPLRERAARLGIRPYTAERLGAAEILRRMAHGKARELGHQTTTWEHDGEGGVVASCLRCGAYAVADPAERPMIYGRGVREECRP